MYDALNDSDLPAPLANDSAAEAAAPAGAAASDDTHCDGLDQGRLAAPVPRPFSRQTRGAARLADPARTPAATCCRGDALSDLTDELFGYYRRR